MVGGGGRRYIIYISIPYFLRYLRVWLIVWNVVTINRTLHAVHSQLLLEY